MLRLYSGLLFVGMAATVHASEEKGMEALISGPNQTTTRVERSGTDSQFQYKPSDSIVMLNRTAVVATPNEARGGSGLGGTSESRYFSQPEKETAPATDGRWSGNDNGSRILSLVRYKSVEFSGEQFRVTLHQDSALIERGHFKVGLRSGTTSMLWSKPL